MSIITNSSTGFPPPPLVGAPFAKTAIPYSLCFVVGTLGNTAVLSYVFFITRSLKSSVTALGNTFIYIVALCAVDLLVTVSIPFSLSNMILNNWVFGEMACKVHWMLELSNKMCSTFILTALAFDRYMAICHPEIKRIHDIRHTIFITTILAALSICLISPVVLSARVTSFGNLGYYERHSVTRQMCIDGMAREWKLWVSAFLIFFAFVLPCTLLTYFYAKIVLRLRRQRRTMLQSRIPLRRITIYTMAATFFYLSCQIPFWLPQIYGIFSIILGFKINARFVTFTYYSHLLPFISAAFNWIFYARLNSQFKKGLVLVTERMIRKRTRSLHHSDRHDGMSEAALELTSKFDDVPLMCPHCEAQLSIRSSSNGKKSSR
uniref:G_PROTEIN_RECEP_F1_2 domain-containing protein n=1 Tax=Caenorhabditis japonica TaxID=281687 RepID=A0A8R1I403_CAEJA